MRGVGSSNGFAFASSGHVTASLSLSFLTDHRGTLPYRALLRILCNNAICDEKCGKGRRRRGPLSKIRA